MIRKVIFWSHLVIGVAAGLVVFVLCLTGALLAFERQSVDWMESSALALPPPGVTERLPADELVARAAQVEPDRPTSVRYASDPRMPVRISFVNRSFVCLNAYTGAVTGRGATSLRAFYRFVREVHTALAIPREGAKTGHAIIDICNLAFVFLILTGAFLWWPRKWNWRVLRNSLAVRFDVRGKARDWNWHNALGFWALIPVFFMAVTGVVLSYDAVDQRIRAFAREHDHQKPNPPAPSPAAPAATTQKPGWPQIFANVEQQVPGWRSISIGWSSAAQSTATITATRGYESEIPKLITLTVDKATAAITNVQTWEDREAGLRARVISRTGHTGEILGLPGQIVASLGCLGGVMLVYTGFALSWRRFFGRKRNVPNLTAETLEESVAAVES
jgi:uncharacterized iron-regulated membrane protein